MYYCVSSILCESMRISNKVTFSDVLYIPQFAVAGVLTSKQSHPKTHLRFLWSGLGYHGLHPCCSSDSDLGVVNPHQNPARWLFQVFVKSLLFGEDAQFDQ